ncbi:hypothetical protein B7P43_G00538 [Cryptotermes secundus]|nr:hypothetical protein B7P43_G00538 [Cryptotermes secundus]
MRVQLEIGRNKMVLSPASWIEQSSDIMEIEGTILTATEMLYRKEWNSSQAQSPTESNIMILEKLLEAYFGDTLCARRLQHPAATTKQEDVANACNSGGMEVDMLVSTVMKDSGNSDFDYQNWTAIAEIPIHVPSMLIKSNRNISAAASPNRRFNMLSDVRISSTFELPVKHEHCPNTIHFNFAGANPMPKRHLKRRILDPRHAQLVCQSVYFSKNCQVGCIGKLVRRQHRITASKCCSANIMTVL